MFGLISKMEDLFQSSSFREKSEEQKQKDSKRRFEEFMSYDPKNEIKELKKKVKTVVGVIRAINLGKVKLAWNKHGLSDYEIEVCREYIDCVEKFYKAYRKLRIANSSNKLKPKHLDKIEQACEDVMGCVERSNYLTERATKGCRLSLFGF